jgi:hypothetical protein
MNQQSRPGGSFYISFDLNEDGKDTNLLVLPCNETFIVVQNNEHLCTLVKTFDEPDYWEQHAGSLPEETIEKMGAAITQHKLE